MDPIIEQLLASDEPAIRYKVRTRVLGDDPDSPAMQALREEIRTCPRVATLLSARTAKGTIPGSVYQKWTGAHWVLAQLADLGYPPGDAALAPLVKQVCDSWLSPKHEDAVPVINGRARRCASQEANALCAMLTLGFTDARADRLAENLLRWQWPDGGWNCDKQPSAATSSFHETWLPLRALGLYARVTGDQKVQQAADRAAEVFLARHLFRRLRDGRVIKPRFLALNYPAYWHYGILAALQVMREAGYLGDPRCAEALDLLESKRLPDGGFRAEVAYYNTVKSCTNGHSLVDWGRKDKEAMNPWVTVEALSVLAAAGHIL